MRDGLPRVDPPIDLELGVTFRPPIDKKTGKRPSNKSISYEEWTARNKHETGPLINAFANARDKQVQEMMDFFRDAGAREITEEEQKIINSIFSENWGS